MTYPTSYLPKMTSSLTVSYPIGKIFTLVKACYGCSSVVREASKHVRLVLECCAIIIRYENIRQGISFITIFLLPDQCHDHIILVSNPVYEKLCVLSFQLGLEKKYLNETEKLVSTIIEA